MIKVGIGACFLYPSDDRDIYGPKVVSYIVNDMLHYVCREDVMPVIIPDVDQAVKKNFLSEMDAFIFQGGSDISPKTYGHEVKHNGRWEGDPIRDQYELDILDYAFNQKKPILGICRGCQLLNVYFGGTLYQDILAENEETLTHRDRAQYDALVHLVSIHPGGKLSKIYGEQKQGWVNSVHHQAVQKVGENLRVEAVSTDDGIIEGISLSEQSHPYLLGVQWHPEFESPQKENRLDPELLINDFLNVIKRM